MPCGHLLRKGWPLGSRLWCLIVKLSLSHWYPVSGVVLDCIDSWYLPSFLLYKVFKPNPNVYYWMFILNAKLVLNAKPGIQFQTWYSMPDGIHKYMYMWYSVPMLAFIVKPAIQSQSLYRVFYAMLIRLVFKAPFGIEPQSFKFKEVCGGIHKYMWYSFTILAINVKLGIQSQTLYLTLLCNVRLVSNASFGIESQSFMLNSIQN